MKIPDINDKELFAEFEKAYSMVAPYRSKIQYRLSILQQCFFFDSLVHHPSGVTMLAAYCNIPFIHPMLLGDKI